MLAWRGFHFGFGPLLEGVLKFFANEASDLIGLIEPFIKQRLVGLKPGDGWHLTLYPHWTYSFVLMWLLFGTLARTAWWEGNKITAIFLVLWGGLVAIVAGALSGTVALEDATSNMVMAFWPIAGVVVFYLGYDAWFTAFSRGTGDTWLSTFEQGAEWVLTRFALPGVLVLVVGTQADKIPYVQTLASPGLTLLAALVVAAALYFLWRGATSSRYDDGKTPWQRFLTNGDTHAALDMLSVMGGAAIVVWLGLKGL